ncbi:MAG TPA: amidohydrolase family protein [Bryobacteraceae bacterium]
MHLSCRFVSLVMACGALSYAAQPVDIIWSARYVITMDPAHRVIEHGAVAVRADRIVAVGTRADIDKQYLPRRRKDHPNSVLMPGLIDTHQHAPMALLRGIANDMKLDDWLHNFIFPAEAKNVSSDFVRWGTRLACLEMLLAGTTTYTDMYYHEDVVAEETRAAGMRGVLGETLLGFPAPDNKTEAEALAFTEKYIQRFRGDPLITPAVAPHAIYTVPDELLKKSRALADKYGVPLVMHIAETKKEFEDSKAQRNGKTPVEALNALGMFNTGRTVGAHGIWLTDHDIKILAAHHSVGLAHCPSSNMKMAAGVARVVDILKAGIPMGIGSDGFAGSNNRASLLAEVALASKLQKVTRNDPTALPADQSLEMATIIGARALGMDKEIGSLEAGKRADMITLSLDEPHATPVYDIISTVAYSLEDSDVRDVMVNGKIVVNEREVQTIRRTEVLNQAREYRVKISESLQKK